ncbi:jg10799 [Pararge aegeria aegeria]|uniref:Jg10799 protein n=1 Tax=Pararge aegeria aegeria TaxID=348720 RepID=A0A8S4RBK9_9NEOP|nr:jg10799 [Pararge aegeria aegeria]
MKLLSRFSYLRLLACSALVAAAPTIDEVAWMCDAARVSTHVAEVTFQASKSTAGLKASPKGRTHNNHAGPILPSIAINNPSGLVMAIYGSSSTEDAAVRYIPLVASYSNCGNRGGDNRKVKVKVKVKNSKKVTGACWSSKSQARTKCALTAQYTYLSSDYNCFEVRLTILFDILDLHGALIWTCGRYSHDRHRSVT